MLLAPELLETAAIQEREIIDGISVTGNSGFTIAAEFNLDCVSLADKRILDVASGCSDLVQFLSSYEGVEAYGVDVGYADIAELKARHEQFRRGNDDTIALKTLARSWHPGDQKRIGAVLDRPSTNFFNDIDNINPEHPNRKYIAAKATALPFPDSFFDIVVSHSYFTSNPGLDYELTVANLFEVLRVLKPSGVFWAGPLVRSADTPEEREALKKIGENVEAAVQLAKGMRIADKLSKLVLPWGAKVYKVTKARK